MIWIDIGMVLGKEERRGWRGRLTEADLAGCWRALSILAYTPLFDLDNIGNNTGPLTEQAINQQLEFYPSNYLISQPQSLYLLVIQNTIQGLRK
jgi:hypothetical protein